MKIFIAGARSVTDLNTTVQKKMLSICKKDYDVLVGDCSGVDTSVQQFFANLKYKNVIVYASNGKARNNIGHWSIKNISVSNSFKGFDFYKQKDIAMAKEADCGFMIWDGKSRGTLNNMINLTSQGKTVLIYLTTQNKMVVINNINALNTLIGLCNPKTKSTYSRLIQETLNQKNSQMSVFQI